LHVSQIYLSDAGDQLPAPLQKCVDRVRRHHPEAEHRLYGLRTLREFIANNFEDEVIKAYDKLKPYAYKADLGRYCLLYRLGGWYFDIAVKLMTAVHLPPEVEALAYRDIQKNSGTCWACSNTILYSKQGNEVFRIAIEQVVQNCRDEYYGITALCPTGPTLLGRAFALHGARKDFVFGDLKRLTRLQRLTRLSCGRKHAFFLPNGVLHAFFKRAKGGDLTSLGGKGTNNYSRLYNTRDVYSAI
jgi:hypothetical protein